jgi:hypothetical protein
MNGLPVEIQCEFPGKNQILQVRIPTYDQTNQDGGFKSLLAFLETV